MSESNDTNVTNSTTDAMEVAFNASLADISAVPESELINVTLDAVSITTSMFGILPELRALRDQIASTWRDFDLERFDKLEQYGLVAEEVAKVYPDLVVFDENGQPQTVRYHFVNAMLLNEVQRQARQAAAQQHDIDALQRENAALAAEVRRMSGEARQIDSLTARLVELEKALGAGTEARQMPVRAESSPG